MIWYSEAVQDPFRSDIPPVQEVETETGKMISRTEEAEHCPPPV